MRGLLLLLAACGGSDGGGGSFEATSNGNTFTADCKLTESEEFMDILATGASSSFEIKWKKALINTTGTFMTGGIVSDLSLFVLLDGEISSATGKVVFTTYDDDTIAGTFEMAVVPKTFTATGSFDCH